jgi:regulator of sigma E protease
MFFLLALGILVGVHEFGHYSAARWAGVKVLRFSFGFGPVILEKKIGETVFSLGLIPLGGFVRMLDEAEGIVDSCEKERAFNRKSLLQRTIIVGAGPAINIAFAVIAYWAMLVIGVSGVSSIVGEIEEGSIAFKSGLVSNDVIDSIDGHKVSTWDSVLKRSVNGIVDKRIVPFTYKSENGDTHTSSFDFSDVNFDELAKQNLLNRLGVTIKRSVLPAVIEKIITGSAAESAGLLSGDEILTSNGDPISSWEKWVEIVRSSPNIDLRIDVARETSIQKLVIRPSAVKDGALIVGKIGAQVRIPESFEYASTSKEYFDVLSAFPEAIERTWTMSTMTLSFVGKMLTGAISTKNLSGPVSIAQYAGQSAEMGLARFLEFLALISISLGILNLLPIPMLDGGHLLYYLIEFIARRPVSMRAQLVGQQIGFLLLIVLMGTAFYNDLVRLQ